MATTERTLSVHQEHELLLVLERAGIDSDLAQAIIVSPSNTLARNVVELVKEQTGGNMLFCSPEQQIASVRDWNLTRGWGFIEAHFVQAEAQLEQLPPRVGLKVPVLVPYFGKVGETFDALWDVVESAYDEHYRNPNLKSDKRHLRLLEGIEHPGRCLRWEIIDLGAHHEPKNGREVRNVRGVDSAHAGVLAAVAHFPKWVAAMDGDKVPYVDIAGYEASVEGDVPWRSVPFLDRNGAEVELDVHWGDISFRFYAAPVLEGVVS
jgi:hypothetical protein